MTDRDYENIEFHQYELKHKVERKGSADEEDRKPDGSFSNCCWFECECGQKWF